MIEFGKKKKTTPMNLFVPVGDGKNIDYDFESEAELVCRCQMGEMICVDCERQRPPEVETGETV